MQIGPFKFEKQLFDLGQYRDEWSGILSPLYDEEFVNKYIHAQFLEDAKTYIERYSDTDYWKYLLKMAQSHFSLPKSGRIKILDIGSGSGNTVFPLMELYPDSKMVASDLSIPLLKSLKDHYEQFYPSYPCFIIQLNAEELIFEEGSIDLVVGGAILHHLIDPRKTIAQCHRVLSPEGVAVFFEPFEAGNLVMSLILKQVLEINAGLSSYPKSRYNSVASEVKTRTAERQPISPKITKFLGFYCNELDVRKGFNSKTDPVFEKMDDKWLFSKSFFEKIGEETGFRDTSVFSIHDTTHPFSGQMKTILRLGLGLEESALPGWVWSYLQEKDQHFSEELRGELLLEGCVIFTK